MLTPLTQAAIAVLSSINYSNTYCYSAVFSVSRKELFILLAKLELANLIERKPSSSNDVLDSYKLLRDYDEISLLDILEALGEHLDCNHPTKEVMYQQYRNGAHRLGIINHMTRLYLSEIKLIDL